MKLKKYLVYMNKFIVYFIEIIYIIIGIDFILSLTNTSENFIIGMILLVVFIISIFLITKLNKKIFKKNEKD